MEIDLGRGVVTSDDVKAAFRKKAKHCHPDVGGSAEAMASLCEARDVLLRSMDEVDVASLFGFGGFTDWARFMATMRRAGFDAGDRKKGEREEEERREWERRRADDLERRRKAARRQEVLRPYRKGCKRAYEDDVKRIRARVEELFRDLEGNPALWRVLADLLKEQGIRDLYRISIFYRPYEKYYVIHNRLKELYTDAGTYQARYRKRKDGTLVGPYWYRMYRQDGRLKQEYVGRELPESARGEPTAARRREKCLREAEEWYDKMYE